MASNNTSEYKVIADVIVSSDEDILIYVAGDVYKNSYDAGNKFITASEVDGGPSGAIGGFNSFLLMGA
jgi:hypothetical protein